MYLVEAELVVGVRLGKELTRPFLMHPFSSYSNFITYSNEHTYISERLVFPLPSPPQVYDIHH